MFLICFGHTSSSESRRQYPTVFSLADLIISTNNFSENRVIGFGGFSTVYKGCVQHKDASNCTVAVKRCSKHRRLLKEFKNEIELLCQLRHPNILSLVGFCNHEKEKIIVYEYMSNGSLYQHLQRGELSWKKRLEICIGVARGLHYLHAGAKRTIIHRHVKPSNILLDDNMLPKLGDFGLGIQGARFMSKPKPIQVDFIRGAFGYRAPEQLRDGTVTDKCDVFSFGVVLLDLVRGKPYNSYLIIEGELLKEPVEEIIDPNIKGKIAPQCWQVFVDIAQRCVDYDADERPTMGEVEVELEHALSLQEQADITNTNAHYTLFSKTIVHLGRLEFKTEENDTEEM